MINETAPALHCTGPNSWHHLIAPTRASPLTESTSQATSLAMDGDVGHFKDIEAIFALSDLAAAAIILSNAIANTTLTTNTRSIFEGARATARTLDNMTTNTPRFTPTFRTTTHFKRAADTNDPQILAMLLIDTIRIANHITEMNNNASTVRRHDSYHRRGSRRPPTRK